MLENPGKRPGRDVWVAPVKQIIDKSPPGVEKITAPGGIFSAFWVNVKPNRGLR